MTPKNEHDWRCSKCGRRLGIHKSRGIYIKHKKAQFVVQGTVMTVCTLCSELNETSSELPPLAGGSRHAA